MAQRRALFYFVFPSEKGFVMASKTRNSISIGLGPEQREFVLAHLGNVQILKKGLFNTLVGPFEKRFGFKPNIMDVRRLLQENGNTSSRRIAVKRPRFRSNRMIALT